MSKEFERKLRQSRVNCSVNVLLESACRVFLVAGVVTALVIVAERLSALSLLNGWTWWGLAAVSMLAAAGVWFARRPSAMQTALLVDERLSLQERFSTTLALAGVDDPFARAACDESRERAHELNVARHFPIRASRSWFYTLGVWVVAAGLVLYMPQKDLFGFAEKKEKEAKEVEEVAAVKAAIKENTAGVKKAVERMGNAELAEEIARLAEMPEGERPENIKQEAIRKLGDLSETIKSLQDSTQMDALAMVEKMLRQLRSSPDGLSQELFQNLAKGNFSEAGQVIEKLRQQLAEGKMSKEQKEALSRQFADIAKQVKDLAEKNKDIEKSLEKLGLNKDLAKLDAEKLKKALQESGLDKAQMEELLKKAQACKSACGQCSALSKALSESGGGAGGLDEDTLAAAADALSQMDSFKEQAKLSQSALDAIDAAIGCLGEGMCEGPGGQGPWQPGESNRWGRGTGGPGKGQGILPTDDSGQTSTQTTRVKNNSNDGPTVASWYFKGSQIKGESQKEFSEVVAGGRDSAAEAIGDNTIPRKYEETVKNYFGKLEEAAIRSKE
jgi:hypothetical protein